MHIGRAINSHTSQHVYRGEDGNLLIDVEIMDINNTPLNPSVITATGETDTCLKFFIMLLIVQSWKV